MDHLAHVRHLCFLVKTPELYKRMKSAVEVTTPAELDRRNEEIPVLRARGPNVRSVESA